MARKSAPGRIQFFSHHIYLMYHVVANLAEEMTIGIEAGERKFNRRRTVVHRSSIFVRNTLLFIYRF